jgi:hypothetical protein
MQSRFNVNCGRGSIGRVDLRVAQRGRLQWKGISVTATAGPHCGTEIEPKDYTRVDWEHLECGKQFIPKPLPKAF